MREGRRDESKQRGEKKGRKIIDQSRADVRGIADAQTVFPSTPPRNMCHMRRTFATIAWLVPVMFRDQIWTHTGQIHKYIR